MQANEDDEAGLGPHSARLTSPCCGTDVAIPGRARDFADCRMNATNDIYVGMFRFRNMGVRNVQLLPTALRGMVNWCEGLAVAHDRVGAMSESA
jgi:hypothetical protein